MNTPSFMVSIAQIRAAYDALCRPLLQRHRLARTAFDIIMFLANNPDCYTAKEISTIWQIKPNVVSIHVEKLVENGYLRREPFEGDRRKIRLVCTEKADLLIQDGRTMQNNFYQKMVCGLSLQDLNSMKHCFETFLQNADHIRKCHQDS